MYKRQGYTDRSSIAKIEKGLVDLQQSKIELFADALGTSVKALVGWDDTLSPSRKGVSINILGRVAAGIPIDAIEEVIDTEEISEEMAKDVYKRQIKSLDHKASLIKWNPSVHFSCLGSGVLSTIPVRLSS